MLWHAGLCLYCFAAFNNLTGVMYSGAEFIIVKEYRPTQLYDLYIL